MSAIPHSHMRAIAPKSPGNMRAIAPKGSLLSILVLLIEFSESWDSSAGSAVSDKCLHPDASKPSLSHTATRAKFVWIAQTFSEQKWDAPRGRETPSGWLVPFDTALSAAELVSASVGLASEMASPAATLQCEELACVSVTGEEC